MWPFLSNSTKKLAIGFSDIANRDAKASLQLFRLQMYAESIYHFQQAVEKAGKAYGLLAGTLQPTSTDLVRHVSHRSPLSMMLHVPEMMERLPALRERLRTSLDRGELKEIGAWDIMSPFFEKKDSEDPEVARRAIHLVRRLNSAALWKISLELDPDHPFTKTIFTGLEQADKRNLEADEAEAMLSMPLRRFLGRYGDARDTKELAVFMSKPLRALLSHPEHLDLAINIYGRAGPELFPLTLLSMCHEKETRYPAIEPNDYWDSEAYTPERGLIRSYNLLARHMSRLCNAIGAASIAA